MHDCRMNWGGSAKAMEADLAVELLGKFNDDDYRVSRLICDDDATTIAKVKKTLPFEVTKESDMNHAKKTVGNDLYYLQKTFKILQSKVISYLQKCFSYVIKGSNGDAQKTREAIQNIVPHVFGEHDDCDSWCKF